MVAADYVPIPLRDLATGVAYTAMQMAEDEFHRTWVSSDRPHRAVAMLTAEAAGRERPARMPGASSPWVCVTSPTSRLTCRAVVRDAGGDWVGDVRYTAFKLAVSIRAEVRR